jgi:hypothetical protein
MLQLLKLWPLSMCRGTIVAGISVASKSKNPAIVALQARPRSADRTRSLAAVSQKREFFKYPPETIGYFGPDVAKFGA